MKLFSVDEIKTWLLKQDSLGDALWNCNEDKIIEANISESEDDDRLFY